MNPNLQLTLGAIPAPTGQCEFRVWAPYAEALFLEIYTEAKTKQIPMDKKENGMYEISLNLPNQKIKYKYCFDNHKNYPDPASRYQPEGVYGPSEIVQPVTDWQDLQWQGIPLSKYIFYELHVGTFSKEGTFAGVLNHLDELCQLGITAIELMPIAQFSGNRNWGYDGVFPFAVQNTYGGPKELKKLVEACHQRGLAIVLDVVYNHFGPEGNNFAAFGPYFTSRYKNPWGEALNFDGGFSSYVRRFLIENAIYWFKEYHIDALRLDALHGIVDCSAYPFLSELSDHIHALAQQMGRRLYLIAESDLNDSRLLLPKSKGGMALDAQWNDDFHHTLHTLLTKEISGYYADFGRLEDLAKAYQEGFVYSGQYSIFRKRPHGSETRKIPGKRFVVFAQNHDQIGNRLHGDRLSANLDMNKIKLAAALVILSPYLPLLFMGEEYAENAPFQYFVSHTDPKLVEAVRHGRRNEFSRFGWEGEIPDPLAEETFLQSKLHHAMKEMPTPQIVLRFYQFLLSLRKQMPALSHLDKKAMNVTIDSKKNIFIVNRFHARQEIYLCCHFNPYELAIKLSLPRGKWKKILDTNEIQWGGSGSETPMQLAGGDAPIAFNLPPYGLILYAKQGSE